MPIRIDLLRHGISEPSSPLGDQARKLTLVGEAAIRALGAQLGRAGWQPDRAYSSPYDRARATLAVLLEAAGLSLPPAILSELHPESTPPALERALLAELPAASHFVLVTHQPLVGLLGRHWTGSTLRFAPGDLLGIEFNSAIAQGAGRIVQRIYT